MYVKSDIFYYIRTTSYIIRSLLALLIVLYIGWQLFLSLPGTSDYIAERISSALSEKLATGITIERVEIHLPGSIDLYNIRIDDKSQKPMLEAKRLCVRISLSELANRQLTITHLGLYNARCRFSKTSSSSPANFQFVLDSLSGNGPSNSSLSIQVKSVVLQNTYLSYDVWDSPVNDSIFQPSHLQFNRIDGSFSINSGENIDRIRIRSLRLEEKSGWSVNSMYGKAAISRHGINISSLHLTMPGSQLDINQLDFTFRPTCYLNGLHLNGTFSPSDFRCFLPSLAKSSRQLYSLVLDARGNHNNININISGTTSGTNNLFLDSRLMLSQSVFNNKEWLCRGRIARLSLSPSTITEWTTWAGLSPDITERLTSYGNINHTSTFRLDSHCNGHIEGTLQTELGNLSAQISLQDNRLKGHSSYHLGIGPLIAPADNLPLTLSGTTDAEGTVHPLQLTSTTHLDEIQYSSTSISDVLFHNTLTDQQWLASLTVNDTDLQLQSDIKADIASNTPLTIVSSSVVNCFKPRQLGITDRWGDASISANVQLSYSKDNNHQDMDMCLSRLHLTGEDLPSYSADSLHLCYVSDPTSRNELRICGSIADGQVTSNGPLTDIPSILLSCVSHHLPILQKYSDRSVKNRTADFSLTLKDSTFLSSVIGIPLRLYEPIEINGSADAANNNISITAWMPHFSFNDTEYHSSSLYAKGRSDSIEVLAQTEKMFGDIPVKVACSIPAAYNTIYPHIDWKTIGSNGTQGHISAVCRLLPEIGGNGSAYITLEPSSFSILDSVWTISPARISIASDGINMTPLEIRKDNQYISLKHINTDNPSFLLTFNALEVSHLQDLLNFHPVDFTGHLYGTAWIPSPKNNSPEITAQLKVNDFTFQDGDMGTLHVNALFKTDKKKLFLDAITGTQGHDSLKIKGFVDIADNSLQLHFKPHHTNAEFLNRWLKGVLGPISGNLSGDLTLYGPLNQLDFKGYAVLDTLSLLPPVTLVGYQSSRDTIKFDSGRFLFNNFTLHDNKGGSCVVNGEVSHHYLKNFGYRFLLNADHFHAYDWGDTGNSVYWGNIFASGKGSLYGNTEEVIAELDITPEEGSKLYYNNSQTGSTASSEFIRFHQKDNQSYTSSVNIQPNNTSSVPRDTGTDVHLRIDSRINPHLLLVILTDKKRGDGLYLHGNGPISINWFNKGKFHIGGLYTTTDGEYHLSIQDFMKRIITIQPNGFLRFNGDADNGTINLKGVYTVHSVSLSDLNLGQNLSNGTTSVNCLLNFSGQTSSPVVTFGLDFPTAGEGMRNAIHSAISSQEDINMQMLYLLTVGRFYTYDYASTAASASPNQSVLAMQSLFASTLGNSLGNVFNQVLNISNWRFGPNFSTGRLGWEDMEVGGQFQGSLLQDRLQLSGNFGYREQNTYANNFVGDFNLRWLLNRKGTISLKAYSETNDRYFSRSSLSTQGGGMQFQYDFNRLKDLLGKKRTPMQQKSR